MIIHATDLLCAARLALQRGWEEKGGRGRRTAAKWQEGEMTGVGEAGRDEDPKLRLRVSSKDQAEK